MYRSNRIDTALSKMSSAQDPNCPNIVIVPTLSLCKQQPPSPNKQKLPVTAVSPHPPVKPKERTTVTYNKIPSHSDLSATVPSVFSAPVKSIPKTPESCNPTLQYQNLPGATKPVLPPVPYISQPAVDPQIHYTAPLECVFGAPVNPISTPVPYINCGALELPSNYTAMDYQQLVQTPLPSYNCIPPFSAIQHSEVYQTTPYYGPMKNNNCISQNFNFPTNWTPDYTQSVGQANNINWGYGNSQHWTYPDNNNQRTAVTNHAGFVTNQLANNSCINPMYNSSSDGINYTQINEPILVDLTISDDPAVDLAEPLVPVVVVDHKDKEPSVFVDDPEDLNICQHKAKGSTSFDNDNTQNTIKTTATSYINKTVALQKITLANGKIIQSKTIKEIESDNKPIVEALNKKINTDETNCHVNILDQETITLDKVAVEVGPNSKINKIDKMSDDFFKENKSVVASNKEKLEQLLISKTDTGRMHEYKSGDQYLGETINHQAGTTNHEVLNNYNNNERTRNIEKMVDEFLKKTNKAIEENEERMKICSKKKHTTTKELKETYSKKKNTAVPSSRELEPVTKSKIIRKREKPKTRNKKLMPSSSSQIEKLKIQLASVENEINKRKRQLQIKERRIQSEIETLKLKSKIVNSDELEIFGKNTPDLTKIQRNPEIDTNDSKAKQNQEIISSPKNKMSSSKANKPECESTQVSNPARQLKSIVNVPRKPTVPKDNNSVKSIVNVPRKTTVLKDNRALKYKRMMMYNKDVLKKMVITKNVTETSVNENTGINLKMKYSNGKEKNVNAQNDLKIKFKNECGLAADVARKVTVQKRRKPESNEDKVSNTAKKIKRIEFIIKLVTEDSESDIENDSDHIKSENDKHNDNKSASDLSFLDDIDVDEIANFLNADMHVSEQEKECINTNETVSHPNVPKSSNYSETESVSSITDFLNQTRPKDTHNTREDTLMSPLHGHVHFQKESQDNALQQNDFGRQQSVPNTLVATSNLEEHGITNEPQIDRSNDVTNSDKDSEDVQTSTKFHIAVHVNEKIDLDIENDKEDEMSGILLEPAAEKMEFENYSDAKEEISDNLKYDEKNASTETINILGCQETEFQDESSKDSFVIKTEAEDAIKTEVTDQTDDVVVIPEKLNTKMEIDTTLKEIFLPVIKSEPINETLEEHGEPSAKKNCPKEHVSNSHEINKTSEAKYEKTEKNISMEHGKLYSTIDQQNIDMKTTSALTKSPKTCVETTIKIDSLECVGKTDVEDAVEETVRSEITDQLDVIIICGKEVNTNNKIDTTLNTEHSDSQTEQNFKRAKENVTYSHAAERFEDMAANTEKYTKTNISVLADHEETNKPNTDKTGAENPKETENHLEDNSKTEVTTESSINVEKNTTMIQNPAPKPTIKCKDLTKLQYSKVNLIPAEPTSTKATRAEREYQITILANRLSQRITKFTGVKHTISSVVHRGTFSTMYKCIDSLGKHWVAKVLNYSSGKYKTNKEKYKVLTDMQIGIPKDNLCMVFLMEGMLFDGTLCYLMDYYPKNLEQALRESSMPFHIVQVQGLARQLVSAVVLLRNHKLVHSDIKPTHILLTSDNEKLKLCGFDDAYHMETTATAEIVSNSGTVQYRPPEVILGHTYSRGYNIDVWSTALVIYEMATRLPLIDGTTNNEVLYQQLCLFGAAPSSMLQECQFKELHYCGDVFMRTRSGNEPNVTKGKKNQSSLLTACLYAYYENHFNDKTKPFAQKTRDIESVRKFCNLLTAMLNINPLKRMTIEFVYANPFIYPTSN